LIALHNKTKGTQESCLEKSDIKDACKGIQIENSGTTIVSPNRPLQEIILMKGLNAMVSKMESKLKREMKIASSCGLIIELLLHQKG
jgi:hypothetical protein